MEEEDKIFNCLIAGAHGYLPKKASNDMLIEYIHQVIKDGAPMTEFVAKRILDYFSKRPKRNS